jgi:hypothetical protein
VTPRVRQPLLPGLDAGWRPCSPPGHSRASRSQGEPAGGVRGRSRRGAECRRLVIRPGTASCTNRRSVPGTSGGSPAGRAAPQAGTRGLIASSAETTTQPTPRRSRIAFSSTRSGHENIWVATATAPTRSAHELRATRAPRWFPMARSLFDSLEAGTERGHHAGGGIPRRLLRSFRRQREAVSRRRSVYFASTAAAKRDLEDRPRGEASRYADGGVHASSPGTGVLYYAGRRLRRHLASAGVGRRRPSCWPARSPGATGPSPGQHLFPEHDLGRSPRGARDPTSRPSRQGHGPDRKGPFPSVAGCLPDEKWILCENPP